MKTNLQRQDETRFVELVSELFQMNEAQVRIPVIVTDDSGIVTGHSGRA